MCDNVGITYLYENPVFHSRMKHTIIDFHYVCHQVQHKMVQALHIHADDQLIDTLTKALPKLVFARHLFKLGLITACLT